MTKTLRHAKIRELIESRTVKNQEELKDLLDRSGIEATQATLSRDLRELGALKGPEGYSLNAQLISAETSNDEFTRLVRLFLSSVQHAGNLVLLKTAPGNAHSLGAAIDKAKLTGILGSIAGDDTIFALARSGSDAKRFTRFLNGLVQHR